MAQIHSALLSLTDPYYLHMGTALHRWATLEYQLMNIIWAALGLDSKTGRVLTVGMNLPTLSGVLRNLPRRWITDPSISKEIRSICDHIREEVAFRNFLAHGVWSADPNDPNRTPWLNYMKDAKERILPGAEQVSPKLLRQFAERVGKLNHRAEHLLKQIRSAPPPSLDKDDKQIL